MSQNLNKQLSFRPRNIDHFKPMQVLRTEDVPDLNNFATINRTVPQMPTGMEKEEECEHHLQRAISAQQAYGRAVDHVIPTPEVFPVDDKIYDELYPPTYKIPRQLIHVQLPSFEQDYPEYDLDSEDETWLSTTNLCSTHAKFEEMIDCLERNSGIQKVIELNEAKSLLRGVDESLQIAVYDYWLAKKLKYGKSLIPSVKTEKRDGTSGNNPYIAFRRRTEKMQTRKNRKNDEYSYEKMLKLKKDFLCVRDLMAMIKEREHQKCEFVKNNFQIFKTRYLLNDFNSQIYNEMMASRLTKDIVTRTTKTKSEETNVRRKRTKRTKNDVLSTRNMNEMISSAAGGEYFTSEDENSSDLMYHVNNETDDADNPDGIFSFRRKKGCYYHAPLDKYSGWPWESLEEGGTADKRFSFNYTSLSCPAYSVLLTRRRIGRGGRINFDRLKIPIPLKDDDNDEKDSETIYYRPIPGEPDYEQNSTVEFNTRYFDEDHSMFLNHQLKHYIDDTSLEKQLYLYNERDLSNFVEENYRHHNNERTNLTSQSHLIFDNNKRSSRKSTNGKSKPIINHENRHQHQHSSFVRKIKVDLTSSLLNNNKNIDDNDKKNDSSITTTDESVIKSNLDDNNDIIMDDFDGIRYNEIENSLKQNKSSSFVNINNGPNHSNDKSDKNCNQQFFNEPSKIVTTMTVAANTTVTTNTNNECQTSSSSSSLLEYQQNVPSSSSSCKLKSTSTTTTSNQSGSVVNNVHQPTDVT